MSCAVELTAQVSEEKFQNVPAEYIKKTKNVLTHLQENPEIFFQYPKLKLES